MKAYCEYVASGADGRLRATHYGAERREAQEARALRLLREEMGRLGWDADDLRRAGKGDERKVRLAASAQKEHDHKPQMARATLGNGAVGRTFQTCWAPRKNKSLKSEN